MRVRASWVLLLLLAAASADAQQTIYWKKDHVYAGPGGKEIAIVTPAPADQTAPTAPSGLASSNLTATSVQLSWSASTDTGGSGLAGYKVYRQVGTGASLPVGTVGALSFTDQHLQPNTSYTFTIVAFDNAQNHSTASNAISLTTSSAAADATAPTVPAGLVASLSARTTVQLNWSPSTDIGGTGVAGYRVYRDGTLISGANLVAGLSYQDGNLAYKTTYSYSVVAVDNAANASAASASASITTDWQLVFQDDFNRTDSSTLGSNWASSGGWKVSNTQAYVYRIPVSQGGAINFEAITTGSQTDFRLTMDITSSSGSSGNGFDFWHGSGRTYQVWVVGQYLYLNYYPDDSSPQGTVLTYTSGVATVGTLRVQTNSATRNIKVYFNGVLKIDYTETDTSRPNTGYVGFFSNFSASGGSATVDNFMLER